MKHRIAGAEIFGEADEVISAKGAQCKSLGQRPRITH